MKIRIERQRSLLWMTFLFLLLSGAVEAQSAEKFNWRSLVTDHCTIQYQRLEDLEKFCEAIEYTPQKEGLKWALSDAKPGDLKGRVARKVDALFVRAQEILDMHKRMKNLNINLYANKRKLGVAYQGLFKKPCNVRSWYLYEFKTIYTNVSDVHAGMLAHEMGHHIVDHYLIIRPPRATAEILARYVDKHLQDGGKKY
jgi:hypothetical protein